MLRGMTGYGRAAADTRFGRLRVEIASLNRRHLEVIVTTPPRLASLVPAIRDCIAAHISRGQVKVNIGFDPTEEFSPRIEPNVALIERLREVSEQIASKGAVDQERAFALAWQHCRDLPLLTVEEESCDAGLSDLVTDVVKAALTPLLEMKGREGEAITSDIKRDLSSIATAVAKVEELTSGLVGRYRERLKEQIEQLLERQLEESDEQIAKQVVLYACKIDTAEEISRLKLHLQQVAQRLQEGKGKPIEFLLQELVRETNTLGSKAPDGEVATEVIEMKSALERIREQIQNAE
jgi:uncharacterized protein (TIGR00255 family)